MDGCKWKKVFQQRLDDFPGSYKRHNLPFDAGHCFPLRSPPFLLLFPSSSSDSSIFLQPALDVE
jgi:hypothetical protein